MANNLKKLRDIGAETIVQAGQFVMVAHPDDPWTITLAALIATIAITSKIRDVLFHEIDLEQIKSQIESDPENAKLIWTIVDAGLRETAKEKLRAYNLYLKGALTDPDTAKDFNSKVLLVMQQILLDELKLFEITYENFEKLQILNLMSSVDSENYAKQKVFTASDLKVWFEDFIDRKRKGQSPNNYLNRINFFSRSFTASDLKKLEHFQTINIANSLDMLVFYGLLWPGYGALGGTTFKKTRFGEYVFNFLNDGRN